MAYSGKTYQIPCEKGGLNYSRNMELIPGESFVPPSRNINLNENGRSKRGGTSHTSDPDWDAAISGTPSVLGLYQFRRHLGTRKTIACCGDGSVYDAHDNAIISSAWSTSEPSSFAVMDNELYIAARGYVPYKYDQTTATILTDIPSDWSADGPGWVVKHGRGTSERTWWGYSNNYPQRIYASALGDADDISDTSCFTVDIETEDGYGIVGACEFGDRLVLFGRSQAYILDDTDLSTANWGYSMAQWSGGAASHRLIVRIPNDIICMTEDGTIYSVTSADNYGDYKAASLVYPASINRWIKEYISLSNIDKFHAVYDGKLRAIKWFMVKSGYTDCNICLVQFIDRPPEYAFTYHDNEDYDSGYNAVSSCVYRKATGEPLVLTGDDSGVLWELETSNFNDNSEAYWGGFRTTWMNFDDPRNVKHYKRGRVVAEGSGNWDLTINWWVDGTAETDASMNLQGTSGILGDTTTPLGTFVLGGDEVIDRAFKLDQYGKRIRFQVYNEGEDQGFFISNMMIDFRVIGADSDV